VGLIAHQLEIAGISTTSVTSARDITRAAKTPRAVFSDFPLGHTTGKVEDPNVSYLIVSEAMSLVERETEEHIVDLPHKWETTDVWKDFVFPAGGPLKTQPGEVVDDRLERWGEPQYQTEEDADKAARMHEGETCRICQGIDF
tara:strand:- start:25 stop:453 length:429 start_codon:yes stop_codon:yes gene_type:complete